VHAKTGRQGALHRGCCIDCFAFGQTGAGKNWAKASITYWVPKLGTSSLDRPAQAPNGRMAALHTGHQNEGLGSWILSARQRVAIAYRDHLAPIDPHNHNTTPPQQHHPNNNNSSKNSNNSSNTTAHTPETTPLNIPQDSPPKPQANYPHHNTKHSPKNTSRKRPQTHPKTALIRPPDYTHNRPPIMPITDPRLCP
jgi:hypothetical protein